MELHFREHWRLTRRFFFGLGSAGAAAWTASPLAAADALDDPRVKRAIAELTYLTPVEKGYVLDKGKAEVTSLPPERLREIGLLPETWSLEVVPDAASGSSVERPLSRELGMALDWRGLMGLAEKHAVRFLHVCVCTNGNDPFHMTLWEGVPLCEVVWLTRPKANIRRVYYQSYHRPGIAPFQASLPLGRVLETPPGETPVVLAYKMNGEAIPASHGGPVRVLVPGAYGNKSIKWVQRMVLTNDYRANDTDASDFNSDVESHLKTRARFINAPKEAAAGQAVALTGMAQVGVSGLAKVQYSVRPAESVRGEDWQDAAILPPPSLPGGVRGFDAAGNAAQWPMRYTIVHWAALLPGLPAGSYELCCRTIDLNGIAQPMPRPLPRTGVTALHRVPLVVKV